jgi:hypothetical protein
LGEAAIGQAGLIWVGEGHYSTVEKFHTEALEMGISRRINVVPNGFTVGETWVLLAHPKAITRGQCPKCSPFEGQTQENPGHVWSPTSGGWVKCSACDGSALDQAPGIFKVFRPQRVEYVVTEEETEEELEALEKRGLSLVKVVKAQTELTEEDPAE